MPPAGETHIYEPSGFHLPHPRPNVSHRGKYITPKKAVSLLTAHPDADAALRRWQEASRIAHRSIGQTGGLFRRLNLTVAEASAALNTTCTVDGKPRGEGSGRYARHHAVRCADPGVGLPHVHDVIIGGHIEPEELARQQRRLRREGRRGSRTLGDPEFKSAGLDAQAQV